MFADSQPNPDTDIDRPKSLMEVKVDNDIESKNRYTFIIGENGVGKSVLFKNILALDFNRQGVHTDENDRNHEISTLFGIDNQNHRIVFPANGWQYLGEFHMIGSALGEPFLDKNNAFVLHLAPNFDNRFVNNNQICSAVTLHPNARELESLFINAYTHLNNQQRQGVDSLIHNELFLDTPISYTGTFLSEHSSKSKLIILKHHNLTIQSFIDTVSNLSTKSYKVSDSYRECAIIYSSAFLRQYIKENNRSIQELCAQIISNSWVQNVSGFFMETQVVESNNEYTLPNTPSIKSRIQEICNDIFSIPKEEFWIVQLLNELGLIRLSVTSEKVPVSGLSSGQQEFFNLIGAFSEVPQNITENLVVFYDEPETSLNPKWQQKFLKIFKIIAEEIYGFKNSHFIIATHSPLIIMEVAKEIDQKRNAVLHFTKDDTGFKSELIKDINSYCLEQLLLDDFGVSYRTQEFTNKVEGILNHRNMYAKNCDPLETITHISEYKKRIDDLYRKVKKE